MQEFPVPISISLVASAIAQAMSKEDLPILAAALTQLGDTLATIAAIQDRGTGKSL